MKKKQNGWNRMGGKKERSEGNEEIKNERK